MEACFIFSQESSREDICCQENIAFAVFLLSKEPKSLGFCLRERDSISHSVHTDKSRKLYQVTGQIVPVSQGKLLRGI